MTGVPGPLSLGAAFGALLTLLVVAAPASAAKQPDLVVRSVTAPASVDAGARFQATDVVRNVGKRKAKRRSRVAYRLSTARPARGTALRGGRRVPKLKPRRRSRGTSTLTLPAATPPGAYLLIASADGRNRVKEKTKRNNCRVAARKLTVPAAVRPATLALTPVSGAFGPLLVGQRSAPSAFTATNTGGTATGLLSARIAGAGFTAGSDGCSGRTLAPGAACSVTAIFSPPTVQAYSASLTVTAPGLIASATLTGTATGLRPAGLTIAPVGGPSFAPTEIGKVGAPTTFTVTNGGGLAAGALSSVLDAGQFHSVPAADTCCGVALAAGASCTFAMVFAPTTRGAAAGSVSLTGAPGGTVTAPVSGAGLAPALLSISPSAGFAFGDVVLDGTVPTHTFTVANDGDVAAGGLAGVLSGGNTADFTITGGTCPGGGALAGGATCTLEAGFDPQTAGLKATSLEISGTPGGSASAALTGRGVTAASIGFDSLVVTFGGVAFNSSATRTLTLRNTGGSSTSAITLTLSGIDVNRFAILPAGDGCSGATLASGAMCSFTIRFTPMNMGARTAFVTATAVQGGAGSARLDGTGT